MSSLVEKAKKELADELESQKLSTIKDLLKSKARNEKSIEKIRTQLISIDEDIKTVAEAKSLDDFPKTLRAFE